MWAAFHELAELGATGDGGVHRPTFHEAHLAARRWFREQIERAGLEFRADGGRLRAGMSIGSGSHELWEKTKAEVVMILPIHVQVKLSAIGVGCSEASATSTT